MTFRNAIWTYLTITMGALLIWGWAASATRDQTEVFTRVRFIAAAGEGEWVTDPPLLGATVRLEGSARALRNAERRLRAVLTLELAAEIGEVQVDLVERLRRSEEIAATGAEVLAVEPPIVEVMVDQIRSISAPIIAQVPDDLEIDGTAEVEPKSATVSFASRLRELLPDQIELLAYPDRSELLHLEPGTPQTISARVRLPDSIPFSDDIVIEPTDVQLTLTVRTQLRRTTLESVRVQLAGPPEDFAEYDVTLEPPVLRNVTIEADSDLIRAIEGGRTSVVAVVHLSSRDKELAVSQKPVAYFLALNDGWRSGTPVRAWVNAGDESPVIDVNVERRE